MIGNREGGTLRMRWTSGMWGERTGMGKKKHEDVMCVCTNSLHECIQYVLQTGNHITIKKGKLNKMESHYLLCSQEKLRD